MLRNHVGYAGTELNLEGATLTSAMFQQVGSADGSIRLSSITPITSDGEVAGWGDIEIQFVNWDGSTDLDNVFLWDGAGWSKDWESYDRDIPAGQGLWVNNASNGRLINFRSNGEVNEKEILFPLNNEGSTVVANCFPVSRKLSEIVPVVDGNSAPDWGDIEIQYVNTDGSTDLDNVFLWDGTGWSKDWETFDMTIEQGRGFIVNNASNGKSISIQMTAPELD